MRGIMKLLRVRIGRAAQDEEGTATIPFLLFMPFFMMLVCSSVEMGMMMVRTVMLERAVDMSVRGLRLGFWSPPTHDELKRTICNQAGLIPDCMRALLIELRPVDKTTWQPLGSGPTCVDRSQPIQPVTTFVAGGENDMMLLRACAKVRPLFPAFGAGAGFPKDGYGTVAIVSSTAFVNEPKAGGGT
jgi:hypothetical protein